MAFKMKGSAFKLGNVATKSVLKHSGDVEQLEKQQGNKIFGHEGKKYSDEELKEHHGPVKMKSPLEQTSFWDKVKAGGKAAWAGLTAVDDFAQTAGRKYRSEKKKYRAKDRKEKMKK